MKRAWQQFVRLLGDQPETAGIGLFAALLLVAAPVALLFYWVSAGQYAAAAGMALALTVVLAACVRDFRRGHWSFVSGVLMALWLLLLALWATYEFWAPYVQR